MLLWNSPGWAINGPNSNNPPPIPKSEMKKKDHCDVSLLIYQSFGMSPIRVELIPRITRLIFPQPKNGLGLEFSVICGQTSPEITTDTRLPNNLAYPEHNGLLPYLVMSLYENTQLSLTATYG